MLSRFALLRRAGPTHIISKFRKSDQSFQNETRWTPIISRNHDVLLNTSDLDHNMLVYYGHTKFGIKYLSETTETPAFPIHGKIIGSQRCLLVNLLVRRNEGNPINVLFVVDTGAGCVMLSLETLRALFPLLPADELDSTFSLYVHSEVKIECILSSGQAKGLNVLGYDYLALLDLSIVIDHKNDEFQLIKVPFVEHDHNIDNTK